MLSNILFICNSANAASAADLASYLAMRALPTNVLTLNFGVTPGPVTLAQTQTTLTVQSLQWQGVTDSDFNALPVQGVLDAIGRRYDVRALILSTYTPVVFQNGDASLTTLSGRFARLASRTLLTDVLPHGRLGSPAKSGSSFNFNTELVNRFGVRVFDANLSAAPAAEARNNFGLPLIGSSGVADLVSATAGFTLSYFANAWTAMKTRGNWLQSMGTNIDIAAFVNGTLTTPVPMFGFALAMGLNTGGDPGAQLYSNAYRVAPGGFSMHWFSFLWFFAMDFLWNGGIAAFSNVAEPFADGLRDPALMLPQVFAGASLCETLPVSATAESCPNFAVSTPDRCFVIGDPLYRPYALQSGGSASGPEGFLS